MDRVSLCTAIACVAASQVPVHGDVEQVVERPPVVVAEGGAALVPAGGLGATVVERDIQAQGQRLAPGDDQVAVVGHVGGFDLDIGLGRGHALEVLQCLFHITQVQDVARAGRHRVQRMGAGIGLLEADGPDASWHQGQGQAPTGEVLRLEHDARGHKPACYQGLLRAFSGDIDAAHPQAAADGWIGARHQRLQDPLKGFTRITSQPDFTDRQARRFKLGPGLELLGCAWGRRWGCRLEKAALGVFALSLQTLLLFALLADVGWRGRWRLRVHLARRHKTGQREQAPTVRHGAPGHSHKNATRGAQRHPVVVAVHTRTPCSFLLVLSIASRSGTGERDHIKRGVGLQ
ncbi:hypothetical protein FQZ97_782340 [compost metagenome]